jgi:hypothetical protein
MNRSGRNPLAAFAKSASLARLANTGKTLSLRGDSVVIAGSVKRTSTPKTRNRSKGGLLKLEFLVRRATEVQVNQRRQVNDSFTKFSKYPPFYSPILMLFENTL